MNGLKTAVLLGVMMGLCLAVGYLIGNQQGLLFGFLIGGGMSVISYFFSDKIALASASAQPIAREQAPELYQMVERLSQRAGLPMPRMYYSPAQAPNAFATGRNPKNGVVCVTAGLMNLMDSKEVEGVLGHELSHIKHRDILISTMAAVMAGALTVVAREMFWFGGMGMGGGGRRDRDSGGVQMIGALLMMILAPIAAALLQMAISRSREYSADEEGARLAGGPEGLISALKKLEDANKQIPMNVSPAQGNLYIVMPLSGRTGGLTELLSTHPPTEKRIARLIEMMHQPNPYAGV